MEEAQDWYFTFGCGQAHANRYVVIHDKFEEARAEMFRRFGDKWCFQYSATQFGNQAEQYNLTELK